MDKYTVINREYSPGADADVVEIVMKAACTTADLPTDVAPGSVAYKVNGDFPCYGFSADGAWEEL